MDRCRKVGYVKPRSARQITASKLGIGFEKLDRAVFDPEKAYDLLAAVGVKHVRLQSGWMRTERTAGVYDFTWLDAIVDRLISDGMEPWMCLCYGNPIYTPAAAEVYGAVGVPPIFSDAERAGWAAYVTALTSHFRGRVHDYEVWNEPDGKHCWKHGVSAAEYGRFTVDTAAAVRIGDPDARVICGALCSANLTYVAAAANVGMLESSDAISYHCYTPRDKVMADQLAALRALVERLKPGMPVIQGESGTQSRPGGNGALKTGAWSESKQCRFMARHLVTDLWGGAEFASYFSCMDMIEALNGRTGDTASYLDYGYFGVLGAQFDDNGFAVGEYKPKPSYRTLQTLAAVFAGEWEATVLPVLSRPAASGRVFGSDVNGFDLIGKGFCRADGSAAYVYWCATDLMTTEFSSTVTLQFAGLPDTVRLVDLCDGAIYELPDSIVERREAGAVLHSLPVSDRPMMLEFGDFITPCDGPINEGK